ncbi:MAG: rod-binding protein [Parvularculaceae bacterium]
MSAASFPLAFPAPAADKLRGTALESAEREKEIRETAREFESVFIAEMLKHTGLDKALSSDSGFGGEAFTGMLVQTYADELSKKGGFGIAEQIYRQLKEQQS